MKFSSALSSKCDLEKMNVSCVLIVIGLMCALMTFSSANESESFVRGKSISVLLIIYFYTRSTGGGGGGGGGEGNL